MLKKKSTEGKKPCEMRPLQNNKDEILLFFIYARQVRLLELGERKRNFQVCVSKTSIIIYCCAGLDIVNFYSCRYCYTPIVPVAGVEGGSCKLHRQFGLRVVFRDTRRPIHKSHPSSWKYESLLFPAGQSLTLTSR